MILDSKTGGFNKNMMGGGSIFKGIEQIKAFNAELANSNSKYQAYLNTMKEAEPWAQKLVKSNRLQAVSFKDGSKHMVSYGASLVGATIKTVALQAASMALQAVLTWGIAIAINAIITGLQALWKYIPTVEHLTEKLEETAQALADIRSERESLNDELKTTQERIAELESKGALSFTDSAELQRLKQENAQLERKIALLDEEQKTKSKEQQTTFKKTVASDYFNKKNYRSIYYTEKQPNGYKDAQHITQSDYIDEQIRHLGELESRLKTATKDGRQAIEREIARTEKYLSDEISTSQGYLDALVEAGYVYGSDAEVDKYIDWIYEFQDKYLVAVGNTSEVFNSVLSRDKYSEARTEIEKLAEAGELTAESLQGLYNQGGNVKEFIDYMLSLNTVDWKTMLGDDFDRVAKSDVDDGIVSTTEALDWMSESGENSAKVMGLFANELNKIEDAAESTLFKIQSLTDSLSELETISDKFSKLGSAISELKEDGYVSIKTINEIAEAFKGAEGLDNYISQIATASNATQLQNSIQGLINSYLNQESVLKGLNDANKQVLITQLQRLGVTNAEEVVNAKINQNLPGLTQNMKDFSKQTSQEAASLYALAKGSNIAGTELKKYGQIVEKVNEIERLQSEMDKFYNSGQFGPTIHEFKIAQIRKEIAKIVDSINVSPMDTDVKIKISMSGLEELNGSGSNGKTEAEKYFDDLKYKLETNQITQEQYLKDLDAGYKRFYNKTAEYLEDYAKYSQEVYEGFKDMYKEDLEAQKEAWEEKKDAVSEYYDNLREQIEDAHDEEDYEKEQSEKRKEIFDLDMQIAELMRDGSEKAKARIAELEEERIKAEEELLDFETDKAREDELSRLEKEQEAEEAKIQNQIDAIDEELQKIDGDIVDGLYDVRKTIVDYAAKQGITLDFAHASGTRSSPGGFGRINEKGIEMISAPDGNGSYINLMPNSYVFSAKATEFLWKLATEHSLPQAMYNSIAKSIKTQSNTPSVNIAQPITITMGDVIIKGNADKQTVTDIKKQQENTVRMVLQKIKELQK